MPTIKIKFELLAVQEAEFLGGDGGKIRLCVVSQCSASIEFCQTLTKAQHEAKNTLFLWNETPFPCILSHVNDC